MKEIKVVIRLTVHADDRDKEMMDEVIYSHLMDMMEEQDLNYTYKVVDDEEDEELNVEEGELE
jgi:hypothetical protein